MANTDGFALHLASLVPQIFKWDYPLPLKALQVLYASLMTSSFMVKVTHKESALSHDERSIVWMQRCEQRNIKLNANKLQFQLRQVKFMGNVITDHGIQVNPAKVSAVTQMSQPVNKVALLRFIGLINYLSPFCENLSTVIQPLWQLTCENAAFISWSDTQQKTFTMVTRLKDWITSAVWVLLSTTTLTYVFTIT